MKNGYPRGFIVNIFNEQPKNSANQQQTAQEKRYVSTPYIPNVSERIN